jgi:thioredoxin-dependent peroxiredoxin
MLPPMLTQGMDFPDFELQDQDGNIVRKVDLMGRRSILYFYPKDDTAG